eukprot:5296727-Ditylum_brightwellii.AAC.1
MNKKQPPDTNILSCIQCNAWSEKETDLISDDVSKLIHDIRNERLTLGEKEKLIDNYKQSRDRKGAIH